MHRAPCSREIVKRYNIVEEDDLREAAQRLEARTQSEQEAGKVAVEAAAQQEAGRS